MKFGQNSTFDRLLHAFFDPFDYARRLGKLCATHDPCDKCGHGRFLHSRQSYVDPMELARDKRMTATQCRSRSRVEEGGCACPFWSGTLTPLPDWAKIGGGKAERPKAERPKEPG